MPEFMEVLHEKLVSAADRILEFLTGDKYRVREARVRVLDVRRVAGLNRRLRRLPPSGLPCDRQ